MQFQIALITEDDDMNAGLQSALCAEQFQLERCSSAWHLEEQVLDCTLDVLMLDYRACFGEISECVLRCLSVIAGIPLIILAESPATRSVVAAMQAGAWAVLDKPVAVDVIGDTLVEATECGHTLGRWPGSLKRLTRQQRRVVQLVYAGRSNREIGEILGISAKTVEMHRSSIMGALGQSSVAGLIRLIDRETGGSPNWSRMKS